MVPRSFINPKLAIPFAHFKEDDEGNNDISSLFTYEDNVVATYKQVADYCNMSYLEVKKIDFYEFALLSRNAYINNILKCPDGKKALADGIRLTTKECDLKGLRALKKKLEGVNNNG